MPLIDPSQVVGGIWVSATAPSSPVADQLWFNTTKKVMFFYKTSVARWLSVERLVSIGAQYIDPNNLYETLIGELYIDEIVCKAAGTATKVKVGTYLTPQIAANSTQSYKPDIILTNPYAEPNDTAYVEYMVYFRNVV
ncbi:MAG: hypothetical protein KME46_32410 [Brasilonema angustatum HA4187-MV1]|jgi:hypothetical protein|nr:hypothetical protein [Brasilonema angustatum HA4187-MV1]